MTWAVGPRVAAAYVAERVPPAPRAAVIALARSSPTGKLRVELVGSFMGFGPIYRKPELDWPVKVKLPVTAVALGATPPAPATWNVRATCELKGPLRPLLMRVSRMRAGVRAK